MPSPYAWPTHPVNTAPTIDSSDTLTWPYDRMRDALVDGTDIWIETTAETYWQQLGVVPPIDHHSGCFLVGEPYCETDGGTAFVAFVELSNRFFCRILPRIYFGHELDRLKLALDQHRQTSPNIAKGLQRSTWHAGQGNGEGSVFADGDDRLGLDPVTGGTTLTPICTCHGDDRIENSILIAAAPAMLRALQLIHANAAESVDWIRRHASTAISLATKGTSE